MKKEQVLLSYTVFDSLDQLPFEDRVLVERAGEARLRAYAPYSKYLVGSALRLDDHTIVEGNNQENAAYPSGLCAERVAIFAAKANHPKAEITGMAVITDSHPLPASPCGSCRQVMVEFENNQERPIRLLLANTSGQVVLIERASDLLPLCFTCAQLGGE